MTSLSVRAYSTGIYRMLGLKEEEVTKVQTGGPDGDLGSSTLAPARRPFVQSLTCAPADEILLSKDKTIAIIDGSGTIHDPNGLDRTELVRLARGRKMISEFDATKLGPEGYRVLVDDRDLVLPCASLSAL